MKQMSQIRLAGLMAFLGSLLQLAVMPSQIQQFFASQEPFHVTWNWNVSWLYRVAEISPWVLFFFVLLLLQWSTARRTRWLGWVSIAGAIIGVGALLASEVGMLLVTPPCAPGILCRPGDAQMLNMLSNVGIVGTLFISASLLLYGIALLFARLSKSWAVTFLVLGLLALRAYLVVTEAREYIPGYFKADPLTIVLELIWALVWLSLGILLWLKPVEKSNPFPTPALASD